MYPIKQSTAVTVPFFAHDGNGDAVTGLTDGSFTKRISKNGAAFGAMTVTVTELENGWYSIPLSTSHSDTLGLLTVVFTNAGAKQINLQWRIEANLLDDLATATNLATVDTVVDGIQTDLDNGTDGLGAIKTVVDAGSTAAALATAQADLDTITGASGVNLLTATQASIDAIELDTGTTIPALLPAALVGGRMDSNVGAISTSATAADNLEASALGIVPLACEGTPTTTVIQTDLAEATDDHYIGRVVVFTTGAAAYQASDITDYVGATGTITVTALTTAPSAGDTAVII